MLLKQNNSSCHVESSLKFIRNECHIYTQNMSKSDCVLMWCKSLHFSNWYSDTDLQNYAIMTKSRHFYENLWHSFEQTHQFLPASTAFSAALVSSVDSDTRRDEKALRRT